MAALAVLPLKTTGTYFWPRPRSYDDSSGRRIRPAMLHRAMLGSLERFLAILLERHEGRLPAWLAPEQVRILPVHAEQRGYAEEIATRLRERGLCASVDARHETLARRVAEAHALHVSLLWVVGRREANEGTVAERSLGGAPNALPVVAALDAASRACAPPAARGPVQAANAFSD